MGTLLRWWWTVRTCARNIWTGRISALAAVGSITLALVLTCGSVLLGGQTDRLRDDWTGKVDVTVYLCTRASTAPTCDGVTGPERTAAIGLILENFPGIETVWFEDRAAAWKAFSERFSGSDITENVDAGALPESYRLRLSPGTDREDLVAALSEALAGGGVETIQDQRRLLSGFFTVADRVRDAALVLALLQAAVAATLLTHLLRSSVEKRKEDIRVMGLVGTPRRQIRAPFVLEGLVVCTLGAGLAAGTVLAGLDVARALLDRAAGDADLLIDTRSAAEIVARIALAGTLLGWATIRLTLARRVRDVY